MEFYNLNYNKIKKIKKIYIFSLNKKVIVGERRKVYLIDFNNYLIINKIKSVLNQYILNFQNIIFNWRK